MTTPAEALPPVIHYPSGDGEPMAETPVHVEAIMLLHQALEDALGPPWLVASDIFWYLREGTLDRVSPDVMVVPEVGKTDRRSFFSWAEPRSPVAVFEMASDGTIQKDLGEKYRDYQTLKVPEYFLFDPEGRHLPEQLLGFRLGKRGYRPIPARSADGGLMSKELGLIFRPEGPMLRAVFAHDNSPVPTRAERADAEQARADAAESVLKREKARAEAERRRADALAAEVERLKKLLNPPGSGATP